MHDTKVVLKDGRTFYGPLWSFQPLDGWFSLAAQEEDSGCPEQIRFVDCVSVSTENQRISIHNFGTQDELARALENGWDGT